MGLDQFAYTRTAEQDPNSVAPSFIWRKHAKLQTWAERLFEAQTGQLCSQLNCGELALDAADIEALRALVDAKNLPNSDGGFFFGHQFQDESAEEYHAQDLEFCNWALTQIKEGRSVYYSCWW